MWYVWYFVVVVVVVVVVVRCTWFIGCGYI